MFHEVKNSTLRDIYLSTYAPDRKKSKQIVEKYVIYNFKKVVHC